MADVTIGGLDPAAELSLSDKIEIEQGEAPENSSLHATFAQLKALIGGGAAPGTFLVDDYLVGNATDQEAINAAVAAAAVAGGGRVMFSPREYLADGDLLDTGGANAQIPLPSIDVLTGDQITIELCGPFPPCPDISVIGNLPVSQSGAIIRSTLTAGSGGNCIGIAGPSGSAGGFSNVHVVVRNLTVRMPSNSTHTAVDLSRAACATVDGLVTDTGSYYIQGLPQPTTATSFGLRMPRANNGALSAIGTFNAVGFYNGAEFAEHTVGRACQAAWGCLRGFVFQNAPYHASHFQRLMVVHCPRGIVGAGAHYLNVAQFNIEHATSGWWAPVADVDDPSNVLRGTIGGWHVILAGTGVHSGFVVNGGARLNMTRLGWENRLEQIDISAAITLSAIHANKKLFHPSSDTTAREWTIPANASVPYPIGTTLVFDNDNGAGALTIAINSDTLRMAGSGAAGSRTLAANGLATAVKVKATEWKIHGTGLT